VPDDGGAPPGVVLAGEGLAGDDHVRTRILEFLGGSTPSTLSASALYAERHSVAESIAPQALWRSLRRGLALSRSLADREGLIAHLDLEYVHFDQPEAPFVDVERCFALQQPLVDRLLEQLTSAGVRPLHLVTGRGHHLLWRINGQSTTFRRLSELAPPTRPASVERLPRDTASDAHLGLGRVLEALSHRAIRLATGDTGVPIQLTAVVVGPGSMGREIVSLDLSEYGDPLAVRRTRIPFTPYRKPGIDSALGADAVLVALPLGERPLAEALAARTDLSSIRRWAARASAGIPDGTAGTADLVDAYERSTLWTIHETYFRPPADGAPIASSGEPAIAAADLPLCVRSPLLEPNDRLLRPDEIQLVTRALLALGWPPRHIAGLLWERYSAGFGWLRDLHFHDPWIRADFYCRLFYSLFADRLDDLVDFNCRSTQEKWECPGGSCTLQPFRDSLLARREHGRLADRTVDGKLLPH